MMIVYNLFFLIFSLLLTYSFLFLFRVVLIKTGLIYFVKKKWLSIEDCFLVYQFFRVPEFNESMQRNKLYHKVLVYLNSLTSIEDSDFTNLFTGKKPNEIILRLDPSQIIVDEFLGAKIFWINEEKFLVLKIRKADKRRVLRPYLQHIHTVSDEIDEKNRELKLYVNVVDNHDDRKGRWRSVPFTHPSSFETLALESDLKNKVKSDLSSFVKAKQYYHRLGRVWKRSYLLYGPSGTGKSSFIAAMANFLSYDVYDIDLSKVSDDSELKFLLLQSSTKSLIVIEDLDRYLTEKSTAVSLSGILSLMDGILTSSCGEERVMVFTMNGKDHVDPAILRPGRIDVHLHFPLCNFSSFKTLANSYLGLKDHKLFQQVEEIFQNGASLSPAEISELMIANRNSPSRALKTVINALQTDGDGRAASNIGRRSVEENGEPSGTFYKEAINAEEFKKLYGLLRVKRCRQSQSSDLISRQNEGCR
ncbi:heat shock cognate 70 kDa protein-like [Hibiscus syriacus]|uniref:Heat shock cognate 70 kDa protein-like n=1 Tax=Hibiscus syriacus TaxID=106335 RepID=A0A6A3A2F6_HIBSY|nr:AAA-ATPase At2g46620-like [Hibiscus syriacus]KAE8698016.1 heat shock cognate 70 kDa protein-like [Hibiscus syriacus]